MEDLTKLFDFTAIDHGAPRTLFLLHGTGGSKEDFLFLDGLLEARYNLAGLQGNVREGGMARFFARHAEGVFDQGSIREETGKLKKFIEAWAAARHISVGQSSFLGYSNGANMLLAALLNHPDVFRTAVLLHPMLPFEVAPGSRDLSRHRVFVSGGTDDPLVSAGQRTALIDTLKSCGAQMAVREYPSGHKIADEEMKDATAFLLHADVSRTYA